MMSLLDIHILNGSFGEGFPNVLVEEWPETPCIYIDVGDSKHNYFCYGWIIPTK